MKIICTTSNAYHHLIPIFCFLFNRNWSAEQEVEIVGYDAPLPEGFTLPSNFKFVSLGKQIGGPKNFGTDLRKYFETQDDWFIWMMEDTFIKEVDFEKLKTIQEIIHWRNDDIGRINLSYAGRIQEHYKSEIFDGIIENTQTALYRLCTQPSIWNKKFLLQYLQPNMTPWEFETQSSFNDGWRIMGLPGGAIEHNEGVTKHDIHKFNFKDIPEEVIQEMKDLKII
jgi:hypothetical protein